MSKHTTTDPACAFHRKPRTWLGRWKYERARGKACTACHPPNAARIRHGGTP